MTQDQRLVRFVGGLRRRHLLFFFCWLAIKTGALFFILLSLSLAADASVGLSLIWRLWARWFILIACFIYGAKLLRDRRARLGEWRAICELEARLDPAATHNAFLNAWNFMQVKAAPGSDFSRMLVARELERAYSLLPAAQKTLRALYGPRSLAAALGQRTAILFLIGALLLAGAMLLADGRMLWGRFLSPYHQLKILAEKIRLEPLPGEHEVDLGAPVTLKLFGVERNQMPASAGQRRALGLPFIEIVGQREDMTLFEQPGGSSYYAYTIAGVREPLTARLQWGEFRPMAWHFKPVTPPAVNELKVRVAPPSYMARDPSSYINPSALIVAAGSRLEFDLAFNRPMQEVHLFFENSQASVKTRSAVDFKKDRWRFVIAVQEFSKGQAQDSWRLRFALTDLNHRVNAEAWVLPVAIEPDAGPQVFILDPAFPQVRLDPLEELAVFWETSDDIGLAWVDAKLEGLMPASLRKSQRIWTPTAQKKDSLTRINGVYSFRPKEFGLKSGDQLIFFLEAKDNNPSQAQMAASQQRLVISIEDFRGAHQENLEKTNQQILDAMLGHLEEALALEAGLHLASSALTAGALDAFDAKSMALGQQLNNYARRLSEDPMASPRWSWGMDQLAQSLDRSRLAHLTPAKLHWQNQNQTGARESFKRYKQDLEKSITAFEELKKEQKMAEAVSAAQRLEDLADRFGREAAGAGEWSELEEILTQIERELSELAQTLSKIPEGALPQEFVNQLNPEDISLSQASQAQEALRDALRRRDRQAAMQAAQQMLAGLKEMRDNLSQAASHYEDKPQSFFGAAGDSEEGSLLKDLEAIRRQQEELLSDSSGIDQAWRRRNFENPASSAALTAKEIEALENQGLRQGGVAAKTKELMTELSRLDREYPALMLASRLTTLDLAFQDQNKAAAALGRSDLEQALQAQSSALEKLGAVGQELRRLGEQLGQMFPGGGSQGKGLRPVLALPAKQKFGFEGGGPEGLQFGPVRIPGREDYRVPQQKRDELFQSLKESRPGALDEEVNQYLRNLLK